MSQGISRIVLHRLLSTNLDGIIHYSHRFERVEHLDSGRLKVHFANGEVAEGDVLVAADGVHSTIRKQLLPESCQPVKPEPHIYGIAGKIFVDSEEQFKEIAFSNLRRGSCLIAAGDGRGIYIASLRYSAETKIHIAKIFQDVDGVLHEDAYSSHDDLDMVGGAGKKPLIDNARDYIFWGYHTRHESDIPTDGNIGSMKDISPQDLLDAVIKQLEKGNWSDELVQLMKKSDVNTVSYWPFTIAPHITDISIYKASNITFIGDSIHTSTYLSCLLG